MPEQLSDAVAEQIRSLLRERNMTGRALGLAAGINPRSIDRKLAGSSPFDINDLAVIGPVLGVAASDLIAWAEDT